MQTDSLWFAKKAHFRLIPSIENFDISLSKTRITAVVRIRNYYDTSMVEQFIELYFCFTGSRNPSMEK